MKKVELNGDPIFIENLPSHARVCLNVILIPEWVSKNIFSNKVMTKD